MSLKTLLNQTITIQTRTQSTGDAMGPVSDWTTIAARTMACRIQPMSPQMQIQFRQPGQEVTHVIYFREDPQLNSDNRFLWDGRTFQFRGIAETDEGARAPLRLWRALAFEDEKTNT